MTTFRPGTTWLDTDGVPINAHGGGLLFHDGTYYWFGEHKSKTPAEIGVACYSSSDLHNWKNEGKVLPVVTDDPHHDLAAGCVVERPKVIYNEQTRKFVMWFHLELKGQGYNAARVGVAVSDTATGPYQFVSSFRPDGQMSRDMTLFVDDDKKAYLFTASEDNRTLHISLLSDDYLNTAGKWEKAFVDRWMEAPTVLKNEGKYYFIGSRCTGWQPNKARLAVAPSVWGPWKELGNPCIGPNANLTFLAQSTYVLPVTGKPGAFIFMADRWHPEDLPGSRYVWLPIELGQDRLVVRWLDEWNLDYFDELKKRRENGVLPPEQDWAPEDSATSSKADTLRLPEQDLQWWRDAKFGMFIHWGLYAIPGEGEWVMFNKKIAPKEYAKLADQFRPGRFDAKELAHVAQEAGMKYAVFTAKHHDGFALWGSRTTEGGFTSRRHAAKRDFVREYLEAFRATGLHPGLYFSLVDWRFPGYFKPREQVDNALQMKAQAYGQVRELISRYGPIDLLWYDGGWLNHTGADADAAWFWEPVELNKIVREWQPKIVINPRSGWAGDFDTEEGEAEIKGPIRPRIWEKSIRANTLGWGYTKEGKLQSVEEIVTHLINAVCRNGNVLLNVGPDADGVIPPAQVERLQEVGTWLKKNSESIYGTRPGPFQPVDRVFGSTYRENTVYVHVQSWPSDTLKLPGLPRRVLGSRCLSGGAVTVNQTSNGIELFVPSPDRQKIATIVALELDGPAGDIAYR